MKLLRVENISSGYGTKEVIHNISLDISRGEVVTLIGSNGAGKSTFIKATYGLNDISNEGRVIFCDEDITHAKPESLLQKGIVYIGQKRNTFDVLNIEENLKIAGYIYPDKIVSIKLGMVYKTFPKLKSMSHKKPNELSGGERQLLALAMGLLHEPKLILFDEPSAGLDVKNMNEVFAIINQLKVQNNTSFLIVEHRVQEIAKITNKWIGLKLGKSIYEESTLDENSLKEIFL